MRVKKPWGKKFAASLIEELVYLTAIPACVENVDGWWIISSEEDWLATVEGNISLKAFSQFMPDPAKRVNSSRSEVIIAALADAVVTCGREGTTWINGDKDQWTLPEKITRQAATIGQGRIVAFNFRDER
jgi:hypothetical protein